MRKPVGSFLLCSVLAVMTGGVAVVSSGCEQGNEPPPESPTNAATRPPDRTEVKMEVSTASPPGEKAGLAEATSMPSVPPGASTSDGLDDPNIGGPQPDPAVEKAVAAVRPRIRACYKKALATDPKIGGSATFDALIAKDGRVKSARFVKRDGLDEDMVGCLLSAVKSMTFDPSRTTQIITLAFGTSASLTTTAAADAGATADAGAKR